MTDYRITNDTESYIPLLDESGRLSTYRIREIVDNQLVQLYERFRKEPYLDRLGTARFENVKNELTARGIDYEALPPLVGVVKGNKLFEERDIVGCWKQGNGIVVDKFAPGNPCTFISAEQLKSKTMEELSKLLDGNTVYAADEIDLITAWRK